MTQVRPAGPALSPLAEPTRKVGKRWIALIALANLGLSLGFLAPLGVLLPNQVQAIAGSAHKVAALGWVTGMTRLVVNVGNAMAVLYLLYYLRDRVHSTPPVPGSDGRGWPAHSHRCLNGRGRHHCGDRWGDL